MRPDALARFAPRGRGADFLFLRGFRREGSHDTTPAAFACLINSESSGSPCDNTQPRARPSDDRMSNTTTRGIRIQVTSAYPSDRSSPKDSQYLFAYHVKISNIGIGNGAAGFARIDHHQRGRRRRARERPGRRRREARAAARRRVRVHQLLSFENQRRSMQGSYQMVTAGGERFDAQITPFTLAVPHALN